MSAIEIPIILVDVLGIIMPILRGLNINTQNLIFL